MTAPLDYTIDVQTPFQSALQGYQAGAAIRNDQLQQRQQQQAGLQQQQQAAMIQRLIANPNPTANDYSAATLLMPGMKDQFKQAWEMRSSAQQQGDLQHVGQVYSAIVSGSPKTASDMLKQRAEAMRNSGDESGAKNAEAMAGVVEEHPEFARSMIGMKLSAIPGGDKVISNVSALNTDQRQQAMAPAEIAIKKAEAGIKGAEAEVAPAKVSTDIANVQSQINERAKRFGLDSDKLTTETQIKLAEMAQKNGELPEFVAKDISAAATESLAAQQSSLRMNQLAAQIEGAAGELGGGITASIGETWKNTFGDQNELSRIRAEYSRIVTPAAMAAYKQVASGSTSDKDIETAMTGVPSNTASPERMAQFLRGAAKLQVYDSVLNNAKSEWLGAVKSLGKAKTDIEVDGVKVPAGTTFKQYANQYVEKKVAAQTAESVLPSRGYMRHAQPAAAPEAAVPTGPTYGD